MNKRNNTVDVMKGIGIISIVVGHATQTIHLGGNIIPVANFVYLYHLAVFFFLGGFLFKEKYAQSPYEFVGHKFKTLYVPFVMYSLVLLVCRPLTFRLGLFEQKYSGIEYIQLLCNIILFQCFGEISSALWFVPVYFIGLVLFCFIIHWSLKLKYSNIIAIAISLLIGYSGMYLVLRSCQFNYRLEIALLIVPIIAMGYIVRKYWDYVRKIIVLPAGIVSASVLAYILRTTNSHIDLSSGMIMSRRLFYPVTIIGVYMCLCFSEWIAKFPKASSVVSLFGKYSFSIMALHLLFSKMTDWFYVIFTKDSQQLTRFPYVPNDFFIFYYIINLVGPIFSLTSIKYISQKVKPFF